MQLKKAEALKRQLAREEQMEIEQIEQLQLQVSPNPGPSPSPSPYLLTKVRAALRGQRLVRRPTRPEGQGLQQLPH